MRIRALAFFVCAASADPLGDRVMPVVGILTQPVDAEQDALNYSLIDASYVRFLESGGALVVPILFNGTSEETEATFHTLSGVLFTGGPDKPTDFDRYYNTASQLLALSMEHGTPLWGTCLGFQMISDLMAGGDVLSDFHSERMSLPLQVTEAAEGSKFLGSVPDDVMATLTGADGHNVTENWHHYGVTPETFVARVAPSGMVALATNTDKMGLPFVSTMEHSTLPIYSTQWHPEANSFDRGHASVNHNPAAVRAMQWVAGFFVAEARAKGAGPGDVGPVRTVDTFPALAMQSGYNKAATTVKYVFA